MVNCYTCDRPFEPDPVRLKAWAESGHPFDPTDWQCQACQEAEAEYYERQISEEADLLAVGR